jgi:type VI secretion system protein ImpJ
VADERCLRRSRWILGIRADLGEADLVNSVPRLIKVCSARFVPELVRRALPGLNLIHLPVPPSAMRAEADKQYFSIDLSGPCWEHMQQTRRVGVYIPGEIASPEFDVMVIVEPNL